MPPTLWPTSLPASRCPRSCPTTFRCFYVFRKLSQITTNSNNNKGINYNTQLELKQNAAKRRGRRRRRKRRQSGRLFKAAKQKQGSRKRQQSRMTKQPRRRCRRRFGRTRNENKNKSHKINNKTEGKTERSRCAKCPTVLTRLDCVFKFGPFPYYYLAYSYIKCSHKMANKATTITTTTESVYDSKHNVA